MQCKRGEGVGKLLIFCLNTKWLNGCPRHKLLCNWPLMGNLSIGIYQAHFKSFKIPRFKDFSSNNTPSCINFVPISSCHNYFAFCFRNFQGGDEKLYMT